MCVYFIFSPPLSLETLPVLWPLCPPGPPMCARWKTGGLLQLWQPGAQTQSLPSQRQTQDQQVGSQNSPSPFSLSTPSLRQYDSRFARLNSFLCICVSALCPSSHRSNAKNGGKNVSHRPLFKPKAKRKSGAARRAKKMAALSV